MTTPTGWRPADESDTMSSGQGCRVIAASSARVFRTTNFVLLQGPSDDRQRSSRPAPGVRCPTLSLRDFTRSRDECKSPGRDSLAGDDHRSGDRGGNVEDPEDQGKPGRRSTGFDPNVLLRENEAS